MIRRFCSLRLVLATLLIFAASPVAVFAGENAIDFVIVGPEAPLAAGNEPYQAGRQAHFLPRQRRTDQRRA